MSVQITIIGLGQIGASAGLALAKQKDLIIRAGYDRENKVAKRAREIGAVDKIENNLHAAVEKADLVLLTLPMDQIRETLELIAPDLREGSIVMETGPVKEVVASWADELLPAGRYYVGLTPVLNPAYLHSLDTGIEGAQVDLFESGMMVIVSPPGVSASAVKLAADLTRLLGATVLFADTAEIDGLMATIHILPQLLAAALLNATVDQPGWREARKIAGRAYAEVTCPLTQVNPSQSLALAAILNRENVLRVIDSTSAAFQAIRSDIQKENTEGLTERLERASQGRNLWWRQRQVADWAREESPSPGVEIPRTSNIFGGLPGLHRKPKQKG